MTGRNVRGLKLALIAGAALAAAGSAAAQDLTARFDWFDYRGSSPANAQPLGADQYRNPIMSGFYPDPSMIRAGDDYLLVTSTFSYFPGLPVFRSSDMVNWTQVGNAIDRPGQLDFGRLGLSRAVFAPTISFKDGTYYILNTCVDCGGNYVISAKDPAGPWSDPIWLKTIGGIDPSFFHDADGRTYIVNNEEPPEPARYEGHRAIWGQEIDLKTMTPFGPRKVLVNGGVDISTKPIWIEGPHIFKRGDWYYLSCAEGGTAEGHSQVILRSKSPLGPFEPWSGNPILTQRDLPRDRAHPITSAGHAQLVEAQDGSWWASFLAVQPYEGDFYNTGRETFLLPVTWTEDGWPVILKNGEAIPRVHPRPKLPAGPARPVPTSGDFAVRDEFDGSSLPPYWMMMRQPKAQWWKLGGGALTLTARPDALGSQANPSYFGRRQQHLNAAASTRVVFTPHRDGDRAGMAALQSDDFFYFLGLAQEGGKTVVKVERRAGPKDPIHGVTVASAPVPRGQPIELKIEAKGDKYDFAYALKPGQWTSLVQGADGKILSTKTAGGFVGATFGPYAYSGQTPTPAPQTRSQ
ncbi:glycoside hydrolase family 43 protein [Phenylobacterium deserti]|uniref:Glycoside hydrolase family 43 protein n=1 Tax=Phenylobacterium deserti TaxID=1914756 RepID=A0A328A9K1_9CAUL|nr:glycoside hydrolase family 43 protein [Phenylobacterium deserti]RAK51342.1 glycoside hydrolase family 43 protein [Phenylobacterium deserti]